jgi:hypothetical protein
MSELKEDLQREFKMTDAGRLNYLLGIRFTRDEKGLFLSQDKYVERIVQRYGLEQAKESSVPMSTSTRLSKEDGSTKLKDNQEYQSMVGSLMYVALAT